VTYIDQGYQSRLICQNHDGGGEIKGDNVMRRRSTYVRVSVSKITAKWLNRLSSTVRLYEILIRKCSNYI